MRKISAVIMIMMILAVLTARPRAASADKNSPPDESVYGASQGDGSYGEESDAARKKKEAERETASKAREAAKRRAKARAAEDAKKRANAKRDAKARQAAAAKRAGEDKINNLMRTGIEYVAQGRFQMGINVLRAYLDSHPRSAEGWYWISRAHHAMGDYDRAQAAVNIALELDPYFSLLKKTPSGLEPFPPLAGDKKEPRPSMSVLPVKPVLPSRLALEPVIISFPRLVGESTSSGTTQDAARGARLVYEPYPPLPSGRTSKWMAGEKFNEIRRWRIKTDRMGIMTEPRVPVAWKGTTPSEVYFWTGKQWARIERLGGEKLEGILYRARKDIADIVSGAGFTWNEADTPSLAAAASLMRYKWAGNINPGEEPQEQ